MDWSSLIKRLQDAGMTQVQIAEAVGTAQSVISSMLAGKSRNPSYALALALIALAERKAPAHKEAA